MAIEARAARRDRDRRRNDAVASLAGSLAAELQAAGSGSPERHGTARALARQLLALVGHQSLRPQPLDVNRLLERLARMHSAGEEAWLLSLDPEIGSAHGDEERIERAIGGLVAQAAAGDRDAGPPSRPVRIATASRRIAASDGEALLPPGEYVMVTIDGPARHGDAPGDPAAPGAVADWSFDLGAAAVVDGDASRAILEVSGLMIQSGGRLGVSRSPRPSFCLALPRVRGEA
jgi:hypothetical protein